MNRLKLIIVLGFAIIFVAGLAVGSFVNDFGVHPEAKPTPAVIADEDRGAFSQLPRAIGTDPARSTSRLKSFLA